MQGRHKDITYSQLLSVHLTSLITQLIGRCCCKTLTSNASISEQILTQEAQREENLGSPGVRLLGVGSARLAPGAAPRRHGKAENREAAGAGLLMQHRLRRSHLHHGCQLFRLPESHIELPDQRPKPDDVTCMLPCANLTTLGNQPARPLQQHITPSLLSLSPCTEEVQNA